jgi:predicted component of type VI protein secretion system
MVHPMFPVSRILQICLIACGIAVTAAPATAQAPTGLSIVTMPDGSPVVADHPEWIAVVIITLNPDETTLTARFWVLQLGETPYEVVGQQMTLTPDPVVPGKWSWHSLQGNNGTLKVAGTNKYAMDGPNGARLLTRI